MYMLSTEDIHVTLMVTSFYWCLMYVLSTEYIIHETLMVTSVYWCLMYILSNEDSIDGDKCLLVFNVYAIY